MEGRELAYYEMVDLEQADQSIKGLSCRCGQECDRRRILP